jgi:hypothetical protein
MLESHSFGTKCGPKENTEQECGVLLCLLTDVIITINDYQSLAEISDSFYNFEWRKVTGFTHVNVEYLLSIPNKTLKVDRKYNL